MPRRKKNVTDSQLQRCLTAVEVTVRERRQDMALSLQELARRTKVAASTICEIENGDINDLRLSTVVALARELGSPLAQFLGDTHLPEIPPTDSDEMLAAIDLLNEVAGRLSLVARKNLKKRK